jgi:AbiV family abortive infection protein
MSIRKQPLTSAQLAELAKAVLENANDLLDDAYVLLEKQRWPRAYALAVLAAEEIGKFQLCIVAGTYEPTNNEAWAKFWKSFITHGPKLTNWVGQLIDSLDWDLTTEGQSKWAKEWHARRESAAVVLELKMAGFYVDFTEGHVHRPSELVDEKTARTTWEAVAFVIKSVTARFSGDMSVLFGPHAQALGRAIQNMLTDPPAELQELMTRAHQAGSRQARETAYTASEYFGNWVDKTIDDALHRSDPS